MRRPIKAHLVNRPVNRSNRTVYQYEPVELSFFNSNLNSTGTHRFPAKPDWYTGAGPSDLTGPVGKLNPDPEGGSRKTGRGGGHRQASVVRCGCHPGASQPAPPARVQLNASSPREGAERDATASSRAEFA